MLAICCIALLAMLTAPLRPCSALARRLWMPRVMLLSCCTSDCAALTTAMRADCESDEVESACTELVSALKALSSVPADPGVP